jgi:hypothetical protein
VFPVLGKVYIPFFEMPENRNSSTAIRLLRVMAVLSSDLRGIRYIEFPRSLELRVRLKPMIVAELTPSTSRSRSKNKGRSLGYSAGRACFIVASIISETVLVKEWSFERSIDASVMSHVLENSPAQLLA